MHMTIEILTLEFKCEAKIRPRIQTEVRQKLSIVKLLN